MTAQWDHFHHQARCQSHSSLEKNYLYSFNECEHLFLNINPLNMHDTFFMGYNMTPTDKLTDSAP